MGVLRHDGQVMNEIKHHTIVIDLDIWQPFSLQAVKEIDEFLFKLKKKELLASCGNVKARLHCD